MNDFEKLDNLYRKFDLYVNKEKRMGIYESDKEDLFSLIMNIMKKEMEIVDELFDDLILPDIIDDVCIDLLCQLNRLTGWNFKYKMKRIIFDKENYEYIYNLFNDLNRRLNCNLENNFITLKKGDYLNDILYLLSKYIDGENELSICKNYLNDRFSDIYLLMEVKNA